MKKQIQRLTDNKFLISVNDDTWTNDISLASVFTHGEFVKILVTLTPFYDSGQIVEYTRGPKALYLPSSFGYVFCGYVLQNYVDYELN